MRMLCFKRNRSFASGSIRRFRPKQSGPRCSEAGNEAKLFESWECFGEALTRWKRVNTFRSGRVLCVLRERHVGCWVCLLPRRSPPTRSCVVVIVVQLEDSLRKGGFVSRSAIVRWAGLMWRARRHCVILILVATSLERETSGARGAFNRTRAIFVL